MDKIVWLLDQVKTMNERRRFMTAHRTAAARCNRGRDQQQVPAFFIGLGSWIRDRVDTPPERDQLPLPDHPPHLFVRQALRCELSGGNYPHGSRFVANHTPTMPANYAISHLYTRHGQNLSDLSPSFPCNVCKD
jgi:hypothetical protein